MMEQPVPGPDGFLPEPGDPLLAAHLRINDYLFAEEQRAPNAPFAVAIWRKLPKRFLVEQIQAALRRLLWLDQHDAELETAHIARARLKTLLRVLYAIKAPFTEPELRALLARLPTPAGGASERALYVSPATPTLLDAVLRLVRLLPYPAEIPVLAPMIQREILFRLLLDQSSGVLHRMAQANSQPQRISIGIAWLRKNFRESFRVEDLARRAGMSISSFHQWFRDITGMSPLQYQKQLRLQEARSILRNERRDVATVSRRVGYESSSQFSREYSRLFGNPPVQEIGKRFSSKAEPNSY